MSKITILIPHYKTGMMTAFTVSELLTYTHGSEVDIVVIDNNAGDGSIEYLDPFMKHITIVDYPKDRLQSHGVAFDYVLPSIDTDYFLTLESDAFPTKAFLPYYESLIEGGFDIGGSLLTLSGGSFVHPAGCLYRTSMWRECKKYCDEMPYDYFPNMLLRDNFKMHTMIHRDYVKQVLESPEDWFELSDDYKPYSRKLAEEKRDHYRPVCGPFHDGRGGRQENIRTFGQRTWASEAPFALYNPRWQKIIGRIGEEPGQAFFYWAAANNKKVFEIPTEVKWMMGKEHQQQEYTLNAAGIRHLWAISAYHDYTPENEKDVAKFKQSIPEQLYATLPPNQRIK